ncbi:ankyrin repeat family protein [Zea mays]|uniref:Ankyrin repeat family protein n=1 Tax=Zea mays TaxID=4577 RepID=A0A1D6QVK0_MAIZE|nr:ankyrin repeat family protein [Zea mays]AQK61351.1 ankyrin repeat family protein [Zea mays]
MVMYSVLGSRNGTVRSHPILRPNLDRLFGLLKGTNLSAIRLHPPPVYSRHPLIPLEIIGRTHAGRTDARRGVYSPNQTAR